MRRSGKSSELPNSSRKKQSKKYEPDEMKKLRYEIIKFGTSGFTGERKEDANVALMVSLGAKPPKNKAKNYKEMLLEMKKRKQNYDAEINEKKYPSSSLPNKRTVDPKLKKKRKKDVKGLLDVYGEVNKKKKRKGKRKW